MKRRQFLAGSLLASGVTVAGATGGPAPQPGGDSKTFLLDHGAWHSALHWSPVAALLAERGSRALAIDLPGNGLKAKFPESYLRQDLAAPASEPSPLKDDQRPDPLPPRPAHAAAGAPLARAPLPGPLR